MSLLKDTDGHNAIGAVEGAASLPPALANALNAQRGKAPAANTVSAAGGHAANSVNANPSTKESQSDWYERGETAAQAAKHAASAVAGGVKGVGRHLKPAAAGLKGATVLAATKVRSMFAALAKGLAPALKALGARFATPYGIAGITCLVAVYAMGTFFFSSHYAPRTTVNGMSASLRSIKAVTREASAKSQGFATQVVGEGIDVPIKGEDIDFSFNSTRYEDAAAEQVPSWSWPVAVLSSHDIEVRDGVSYDEHKLESLVETAVEKANKGATQAENASIAYSAAKDKFVVVDEKEGTAVDLKSTVDVVSKSVSTLQDRIELGDDVIDQPTVVADSPQMEQALAQAEERANLTLTLAVGSTEARRIDSSLIASWLKIDDDYHVVGDLDAITEWTRGDLSRELDSVGTTRTYKRPDDGKQVTVTGGSYGWSIDGASLAEIIAQRIADNSSEPIEIPMLSYGEVFAPGGRDWGNRYIDVDISEQNIRVYDDNGTLVIWEQCVTGNPSLGFDTVEGVYSIYEKESPKLLIGLDYDNDGKPDYENEVAFWMPFWGGYGLHDAQWRGYFGADAYYYDGSHGCVNLPYETAAYLYEIAEVGDVVVVHY